MGHRTSADLDIRHDPGPFLARDRATALPNRAATAITLQGATIHVGTASWTDPTLTSAEIFYPAGITSPEERLRYYASRFSIVEVDSSFYALPTRRIVELWVRRTPADFVFSIKANALMTGHPTETSRLPKILREALPAGLATNRRIYGKDLPGELYDAVWAIFLDAISPLQSTGKLGSVLFQYPRWFVPSAKNAESLIDAHSRLGSIRGTVEFRNSGWLAPHARERTLTLLASHQIPFVMVDEPQGFKSSVSPIVAVTSSELAVLRMHGQRTATWEAPNVGATERFRYLYDNDELASWMRRVVETTREAHELHILFNNCYANYGTTNAAEFRELLLAAGGEYTPRIAHHAR